MFQKKITRTDNTQVFNLSMYSQDSVWNSEYNAITIATSERAKLALAADLPLSSLGRHFDIRTYLPSQTLPLLGCLQIHPLLCYFHFFDLLKAI